MKAVQLIGVSFVAAVIGAGVDRALSRRSSGPPATFEIQDVKWFRTEREGYASDSGTARVVGTGAASTGRYLVLVEFLRSRRVNAADKPDTLFGTVITSGGAGAISGEDHGYSCVVLRNMKPPACAPELRELGAEWRVAGWTKLVEPPSDSAR